MDGVVAQPVPDTVIEAIARLAMAEDCARAGDLTGDAVCAASGRVTVSVVARQPGLAAGYDAAAVILRLTDRALAWQPLIEEGRAFEAGAELARIEGPARAVLRAERPCLNFISVLSGTATLTRAHVDAVRGTGARIAGTRKTLPGMRALQIRAILLGGGISHRHGLDDALMVKDNHIAIAGSVSEALRRAKEAAGHLRKVEIEIDTLEQLDEALALEPDAVLLDNMLLETLRAAVKLAAGRCVLEASGGVTLETVREIAETGVDLISVGALTLSAPALDVGLDWVSGR